MPAVLPFVPMIASGLGLAGSVVSGINSSNQNNQAISAAKQSQQQQQALINQLMSGINPAAYQEQARIATAGGLDQLGSDFAGRGLLSSGAMYTAGANLAGKNYADAQARYQQDRISAIGAAMGGQSNITQGYGSFVNPNPWGGLAGSLGGLGTAAGQYLYANPGTPSAAAGDPAFGAHYQPVTAPGSILGNWGK